MMNLFSIYKYIFVLLSVVSLVVFINLTAVTAQNTPQYVKECETAEKASDADIMNLKNNTQPRTEGMKCLLACFLEKTGKIVNNTLNIEEILTSIKPLPYYSEQMRKVMVEILNDCKNVTDANRCEYGSKITDCLAAGAKKKDLAAFHHH